MTPTTTELKQCCEGKTRKVQPLLKWCRWLAGLTLRHGRSASIRRCCPFWSAHRVAVRSWEVELWDNSLARRSDAVGMAPLRCPAVAAVSQACLLAFSLVVNLDQRHPTELHHAHAKCLTQSAAVVLKLEAKICGRLFS